MENKSKNYCYIEPRIGSNIFEAVTLNNHEKLIFGHDKESGLRIVLAIHNTILGPSTGGTRIANVSEEKAIEEALRLSYAMTYKNAIIDEPFGGSKAVIIGDPSKPKSKQFLHAIGDFIESLRGTFLTGVDMGLSLDDAKVIAERTKYIFNSKGCSGETTAHGVFKGIEACLEEVLGNKSVKDRTVAIQGLGNVGGTLARLLMTAGAKVIVADNDKNKVLEFSKLGATVVNPEEIYSTRCDVFAPCAIGEILNEKTIPELKCLIVAGGANNQFKIEKEDSFLLKKKSILHAPDFIINAGGVCHGMCEVKGLDTKVAMKKTDLIPGLLKEAFKRSKIEHVTPILAAYKMAHEKIELTKKNK